MPDEASIVWLYETIMLIWIIFAGIIGTVTLAALMPLTRKVARPVASADARAMYDAQMGDIERDLDRGVISAADAELARAEIARRLIRASKDAEADVSAVSEATYRRRRAASAIILSTIPLVALTLYGAKGSPKLPALPLSARMSTDPGQMDLAVALTRVENHLQLNPEDGRGWEILAPIYLRTGRYDDAARAFANAAIHLGPTMERLVDVGEARVLAASGVVTADARAAFEEARKRGTLNPKGQFYLAIGREQDGDKAGAVADLRALLATATPDSDWAPTVAERIARMEGGSAAIPQGGEAIAALAPQERSAMIRGMVDGLSTRLDAQGGSAEEWMRLIRARMVMGEEMLAREALAKARKALSSDIPALSALDALAREGGLETKP
jgi:cytochrome c-type biogenesis protein CcmH